MRLVRGSAALLAALALAVSACSGGGATQPPAQATAGPTAAATSGGGEPPCQASTGTTTVTAAVAGNTWQPATINAKVGDVITWTNGDTVPHQVELDDKSCAGSLIGGGQSGSLEFSKAGSFPFHCKIHPSMKGTFVIG